ncbi:MAG: nitrogen regulation protein NR(II) [Methanomassiliicoccales archaeon]
MNGSQVPNTIDEYDERFRIMADVAPVLIWMAGLDKLCYFFNQPWLDFTGRTMEQEMGNGWAEGVHPDDFDRCLRIYTTSFDAREDFRMEYRLKRHDGQYRWILDTGRKIVDENGDFRGFIGSCVDVQDMKDAEERSRVLQDQVYQAQKMEAIGTLAAGLAHDLKNMMTVARGNAELILMRSDGDSKTRDQATRITEAVDRASALVRKLLIFSRREPMKMERIDSAAVIGEMMGLIRASIPKTVSLELDHPEDIWPTYGDVRMLEQVLLNLVTNAKDAVGEKGRVSISLRNAAFDGEERPNGARPVGRYVAMCVEDDGVGMSPQQIEHIFEPFYTTKTAGQGTGLGLPVVYGIVKEHGGWVEVESVPGKGSRFTVFIKADPETAA